MKTMSSSLSGIAHLAGAIEGDFLRLLPHQRKTQRQNLCLLIATMLIVKSANTMDLAAALPRTADRIDMRYQWIWRTLANHFIAPDTIMSAFAAPILQSIDKRRQILVLILDQTTAANGHEILMLSLRLGNRALPLFWRVKETEGNIGFEEQTQILDSFKRICRKSAKIVLLADRFYGSSALIQYCNAQNWDYRIRLKGNTIIRILNEKFPVSQLTLRDNKFIDKACLANSEVLIHLGFIHEEGHAEPWIIAMGKKVDKYKVLDYGMRWGIEAMFGDFKTRGFGLENIQLHYPDRLSRLILVMALSIYYAVNTGLEEEQEKPLPEEKKMSA